MAAVTPVNSGQLVQCLLEYGQRVRDVQERAWAYSQPQYLQRGLPMLHEAMSGPHSQFLSCTGGGDAKQQKEFLRLLAEKAPKVVAELHPLVSSLKVISQYFSTISQLLAELNRVLGSLTLRSYPDLLHQFMDTFCGAVKAGLLLEAVPRKAAAQMVQMVQLALGHVDKEVAAQLKTAVSDPIFSAPSMVSYMQSIFNATMPRIAQVLELVVGPAMTVADNCEGVAAAGLLEMTGGADGGAVDPAAEAEASAAMGMFGMTRQQVYPFLRHRETIRQWGILGFLIFPEILKQPNSPQRLRMLLADGFALHLYKERLLPVHQLMLQHLGSQVYAALGSGGSGANNGNLSPRSGGLGGLLGKGMAIIGGVSRLRKSLTDDSDSNEIRPPHPLFVDAASAAAVAAPLQHRMWRAYVTGQLRSIHAACSACPARIPGQMDMLLAALSLGREELLWFCRRAEDEVPQDLLPILRDRGVINPGYACSPTADDAFQALQLLSAMDATHRLLVQHHSALCKQIKDAVGADLQAHVVSNTPRVEFRLRQAVAQAANASPAAAAAAAASGATGLQPFKDLTDLLRSVLLTSTPPSDSAARVSSACGIWIYVSLQLASAEPPLKAAKVLQYAENTRYLDVLQKSLDAARLLYEGPLLHASAADLAPVLQGKRVDTLRRVARAAICSGRVEHIQAALGAMQGLHWLLPARIEAYAAATSNGNNGSSGGNSTASAMLSRNSTGSGAAAGGRNGGGAEPGVRSSSVRPPGATDDLPNSCMRDVLECLNQLLEPVVMAPVRSSPALNGASRFGTTTASSRPGGPSLMRVMSRPKDKDGSGGGRSATPERVRPDASESGGAPQVAEGPMSAKLHQLADAARDHLEHELEAYAVLVRDIGCGADAYALPAAAELAARLLPLVLALDNGRMLLADSRGIEALSMCRAQLVEALRHNFSKLLDNTADAISKAAVPVPSVQLGPLRLFVEVVSILQPHLATELLPELARLLLQQVAAPTLQTIGLEAMAGPPRAAAAPPSTSAEAAAPTAPNADGANVALPLHAGSMGSGGSVGPMTRSLNMGGNSARTSLEAERGVGPMTQHLSSGGGAAPTGGLVAAAGFAPLSIVRALHEWLWRTVIIGKDERHPVVWYDAEVGAFLSGDSAAYGGHQNSSKGGAGSPSLATATCVRELSLIFELFGPCAAADLTRGCDHLIHQCLEEMQAFLDANAGPLQDLLDSAHMQLDKRLAAVSRALPGLTSPGSAAGRGPQCLRTLADSVQRLGRCLALRVQLGRAAATAAERVADFVTLALREMSTPANVSPFFDVSSAEAAVDGAGAAPVSALDRREWATLLRLSSGGSSGDMDCSYGGCLLPDRDDMLLTAHLGSMLPGLAAAQRWHRLPALMAALMAAPQWSAALSPPGGSHLSTSGRSSKGSSTPRGGATALAAAIAASQQGLPAAAFVPLTSINTVAVAMCFSLQAAMSQVLHPAASQFLLGCGTPVAAMLCIYQRTALAVSQYGAVGGNAECHPAATAAKQQMLAALEQLPLLRSYNYAVPYMPHEVVVTESAAEAGGGGSAVLPAPDGLSPPVAVPPLSGSLELSQSWWAGGNGVNLSLSVTSQPLIKPSIATGNGTLVQIEACEPSLVDGRWSGEVDGWRPPSRLLPLVMGHVG